MLSRFAVEGPKGEDTSLISTLLPIACHACCGRGLVMRMSMTFVAAFWTLFLQCQPKDGMSSEGLFRTSGD